MPERIITVFDPNITRNSPAGSCLRTMLLAAGADYKLQLFTSKTDLKATSRLIIHRVPLPRRPVLLQNMAFTLLAVVFYLFSRNKGLTISTQGAVPFCDIVYAHNPHKLFLALYRKYIIGDFFTRGARLLNYLWIATLESIAFRRARIIVVPSSGLADELTESHGLKIDAKLRVIVNPVDCKSFSPDNNPSMLTPRPFTFAFCALGNFEWKGLGLILSALATGIDAQLNVIGGTAAELAQFIDRAKSLNVLGKVNFLGPQNDIRPYLDIRRICIPQPPRIIRPGLPASRRCRFAAYRHAPLCFRRIATVRIFRSPCRTYSRVHRQRHARRHGRA